MKMNDAFERSIQQSLEGFEVPYNSSDWAQMEQALDGGGASHWWSSPVLYAALLAGVLAVGSGAYLMTRPSTVETAAVGGSESAQKNAAVVEKAPADQPGATSITPVEPQKSTDEAGMLQGDASNADAAAKSNATEKKAVARDHATNSAKPSDPKAPIASEKKVGAFVASLNEGCEGSSVEFSVNNMPENGIYLWNFGDGKFDNKPNPSHTFNKPGKFTVTLSMSTPGKGTITNEPYADLIVIHEVPEASFNTVRREYTGHVPSLHFENRSHGGSKYHWDFGDGSTSTIAHPDHVYREKGTYKVTLHVINETGCEDMIEKDVRIDSDYSLLAPQAFSPNGDGDEDHFMPQALKDLGVKFHLSIFEPKTGRLVYETSDASKPWTGRMSNTGNACAPGQYVWMVEIQENLPIGDITYEGKVSLVN